MSNPFRAPALPEPSEAGNDPGIVLFLGLYLLLLAFFILLNGISQIEEERRRAVVGSVTATFRPAGSGSGFDAELIPSVLDDALAAQNFQSQVADLLQTIIPLSQVEVSRPGELMHVVMPAAALFEPGADTLREDRLPMLRRIATQLASRPAGMRFEAEFAVGSAGDGTEAAPPAAALARAANAVRLLRELGAPADALGAGLRPGSEGEVVLTFLSLPREGAAAGPDP